MQHISSLQNSHIKQLVLLQEKARERKKQGLFTVEGLKEVEMLFEATYQITACYIDESLIQNIPWWLTNNNVPLYSIDKKVFEKISYRESTSGIVALAKTKEHTLDSLQLKSNSLIIVVEHVEKPGNLGAVIRTADACGADAVIVCEPAADIYNPNCIRNSVGTFFNTTIAVCNNEDCFHFLQKYHIRSYATAITTEHHHYDADYIKATAFIFGTESKGLSPFWLQHADEIIKIPMLGKNDSLNVSNSVAICVYEALRQRMRNVGSK